MSALLKLFFQITILGKGPKDVPYSPFLFVALLIILFIADLLINHLLRPAGLEPESMRIFMFILLANVIVLGLTYLFIYIHGLANRAIQTLTALLGAELIIKLVQIPVFLLTLQLPENKGVFLLLNLIIVMTSGWGLMVNVHIYRQALSISAIRAVLITLALFSLQVFLVTKFFPEAG